jgi:hypothetical protein
MRDVFSRKVEPDDVTAPGNFIEIRCRRAATGEAASIKGGRYGGIQVVAPPDFERGSLCDAIQHVKNNMHRQGHENYEIRVVFEPRRSETSVPLG